MFKLLEFLLGSLLITVFTVAAMFFFALHHILRGGDIAECVWQGSVRTWLDADGDGLSDPDEPPLNAVEVHVDDVGNQLVEVSWPALTNREGQARLFASIPGCKGTRFEIYVDIPEGYRLTTRERIEIHPALGDSLRDEDVYAFGFKVER